MVTTDLLRITDLVVEYRQRTNDGLQAGRTRFHRAVDGVSFAIGHGETLGLVGESGSGKSTIARTLVGLEHAKSGHAYFGNRDLLALTPGEFRHVRRHIQIVFQDPYSSLNPRLTVAETLMEPLIVHELARGRESLRHMVNELLLLVELDARWGEKLPQELSGGQRQRVAIARALAVKPALLICDEPVSALDVSIQAQILNLFRDLQEQLAISLLFISHDLSVVQHISDRVAVLYQGKLVESGEKEQIYREAKHPYTKALLAAKVGLQRPRKELNTGPGEPK